MKVVFKNVLIDGKKQCEITHVSGILSDIELIPTYLERPPYIIGIENGFRIPTDTYWLGSRVINTYKVGVNVSPETKGEIIKMMKKAGKKLYEINKQMKEWEENWEGKEEVVEI